MKHDISAVQSELAPSGCLRVAINLGNPVLAQRDELTGHLEGVSVALAKRLAMVLGVPCELTAYDAAGKVFAALENGSWDLAFLAIDPLRAQKIAFSSPYVVIEGPTWSTVTVTIDARPTWINRASRSQWGKAPPMTFICLVH
ncbi:hypothetical protein C4K18_3111 [Pseudomonas chlororaphis subsp. aurantiaca]|nr:hypothetical protein C4K18_3111 [Pseudomonas chlororaphis subsp. aurantiaca]